MTQPTRQHRRLAIALCIVVALVASVPGIEAFLNATGHSTFGTTVEGFRAANVLHGGDAEAVMARIEGLAASTASEGDVPAWFAEEVGLLPGADDIRLGDGGWVVGYVVRGPCADTLRLLNEQMEGRGWTCVQLGGADGATYVKSGGACTWVLATCTQVVDSTSVVLRCNGRP